MGTKQALIKTTEKNFFKHWLALTKPMHKLNNQCSNTLALLLYYYFDFKKQVDSDELAWKLTFDYDTKMKIVEELNLGTNTSLNNILSMLRKQNVIINNQISKVYIPMIDLKKSNTFTLIYKFEIND